jgi:peroxiredoxin
MCTTQLGKLQRRLDELTAEGAAVFAVSIDTPEQARRIAQQFGLTFPILSDPGMRVIQRYGMKGEGMEMADLGYAVIDRNGKLVAKRIDREFGNHVELLLHELRRANTEG